MNGVGRCTIPSYLIDRQNEVISPAAQRFMAKRANADTIEINSSHASYLSHPVAVTKLILRAARKAGRSQREAMAPVAPSR